MKTRFEILTALAFTTLIGLSAPAHAATHTIYYVPGGAQIFWQITVPDKATGAVTGVNNGLLGAFTHMCASVRKDSGLFFVLDSMTSAQNEIQLYVYEETPTDVTLKTIVNLPATGDINATCSLGMNDSYIYAGTNTSNVFAINLTSFAVSAVPTYVSGPATSMIGSHEYVAINQVSVRPAGQVSSIIDTNNNYVWGAGGNILGVGVAGE